MQSGELLAMACVMFVPMIYVLRLHEPLLLDGRLARGVAVGLGFLALVGAAEAARHGFERRSMVVAAALPIPFVHRLIFLSAYRWFVRRFGREPVDVVHNREPGLAADRAFAIVVLLACIVGGMAVTGYFEWGSARVR
ncbi:MAG TPA: hypothetical protein VHL80_06015 [Polyangia bacterium]|nr:hypothetical protein [Polyangia bacterium]